MKRNSPEMQDEFLSEEDLDLRNLSWQELVAYWNLWLLQAQSTNNQDQATYSHGVFDRDPAEPYGYDSDSSSSDLGQGPT